MSDIALSIIYTLLQDEYQDLNYCVTCGSRGIVQLYHKPKRQYRKKLGLLFDLPFLCVYPQCQRCRDNKKNADQFDNGDRHYMAYNKFERTGRMLFRRQKLQRRFVKEILKKECGL
jgi:hypothetical protein